MTGNLSYLSEYEPYDGGYVSFGYGGGKITGKGIIKTGKLEFENVYFVKELKYNLFSVSQICDNKNSVLFTDSKCIVLGKYFKLKDDTNVLLRTPRQHNMYSINLNNIVLYKNLTCLVAKASVDESMLWHKRLGHLNFKTMNKLVRHNLVKGLPSKCFENDHTCVACLKGKHHKASCKTKLVNSVSKPLYTLHMDLFGPTSVSSLNHKWYCLVATNDFTRFTWTFFLRTKDETSSILRNFISEIENLKDLKVKIIRVLVNKSQNKTPYELFNSKTPAIGFLRLFGCHVMILNTLDHLGKFDAKGDAGYFVGYSLSSKAFRVFNKRTKKVKESLHVDFLENKLIEKGAGPNWLFDIDTLTNSMNYVPVVFAGTSSTNISCTKDVASQDVKKDVSSLRYIALPNWFHEAHMETRNSNAPDGCNADVPESDPTTTPKVPSADQVEPAVSLIVESEIPTVSSPVPTVCLDISPESSSGPRLITKEDFSQKETPSLGNALTLSNRFEETFGVEAVSNMETSIPVSPTLTFRIHKDHPKSQIIGPVDTSVHTRHKSKEMEEQRVRPIGTKWVLKNKKDKKGIVIRNKAMLVAQRYTQEEGIDYEEVFALVAKIDAIRLFLAYASFMGFIVYQMDVKSAFLYGTIDEEVYVMQPYGFQDPEFPDRVYKVEKAMYGLHQAPRAWYGTLSKYLLDNGFQMVEALMHDKFQMSVMGELTFFLGLQVLQKKEGIFLSQDKYVGDILKKFGYSDVRPNIMFAVCACARHQVTPKECHLHAVKRIFRYLKGHPKLGLWYPKESPFDLVAYSDSDNGGATQDRKSTTGGCQFLGRRLISWECKKQTIVATSTTEAEYVAAASGCGQVLWIQNQMLNYGVGLLMIIEVKLAFYDYHNMVAILEKTEHNTDFHQIVDFLEASHIRYALTISPTVYVSHIRQFWSTARIETTNQETKILATIDGKPQTISESSLRRHLKLNDEEGISSLPDAEQYTRRAIQIDQSKALSPAVDEPTSLSRDDRQGEAFPTISSLDAGQDRKNIAKTSSFPYESSPRVTSLDADEGSMQQRIYELMELCTSLQRQQSHMAAKIKDQDQEISELKARVKFLEDRESRSAKPTQEDAPITGGTKEIEEELGSDKSTGLGSNDTKEMVNVLSSMEATNILTSGGAAASVSLVDVLSAAGVPTVSGSFPTSMRSQIIGAKYKGKEKVVESEVPKKRKLQEQIDAQVAKKMEEEFARENQRLSEQLARDFEITRLHVEEELKIMIEGLDRNNEVIAKHLTEYEQAAADLSVGEKLELIKESERVKRQGLKIDQGSSKRMKTFKSVSKDVSEEELKGMMQLIPLEEIYVEALQVKHPIIDWKIHSEGNREYWKIIRLGGHTTVYQLFVDMLKQLDREDLHQLWTLVKETLSIKHATKDNEKELWVEMKSLFEPEFEDQLWTHNQAFMHDHLDWKLYDTCGVHHVSTKDQEIFMLVEKDYPLRKGLAILMIILDGDLIEASSPVEHLILETLLEMQHQVYGRIVGNKILQGIPTASYDDPTASALCHC
nr:hypothetical protein [Tanacetum cinerariifolium]